MGFARRGEFPLRSASGCMGRRHRRARVARRRRRPLSASRTANGRERVRVFVLGIGHEFSRL